MTTARRPFALLALLLITAWGCMSVVHEHWSDPSCQICNALHTSSADLVSVAPLIAPTETSIGFVPESCVAGAASHQVTPQGRAPPTA